MRMYLMLRDRAQSFREDPAVQQALRSSGLESLAEPTLTPGETIDNLRFSAEAAERLSHRGYSYVQLSQLAVEHLLGAR